MGGRTEAETSDQSLRNSVDAIVDNDEARFCSLIAESPALAIATFFQGAKREGPVPFFIKEIGHYVYAGDTALHFAAAAYRRKMAEKLVQVGAGPRAKNRRGSEPLHAAAFGSPGSERWDPGAQVETITCLIKAGADPNASNMDGATPLHRAVRTRCVAAVRTLLDHGASPAIRNKNGSTPLEIASRTTGRSGSGLPEAKTQQQEILLLLQER